MKPLTKKEKRIVTVYLKCKIAEEGLLKRRIKLDDCFDCFALGKELSNLTGPLPHHAPHGTHIDMGSPSRQV